MMQIVENVGAPLTLFVEAEEFRAMEAVDAMRRDVRRVRDQLGYAISLGHDVQLHIHPQWREASLRADGRWVMDDENWRIGDQSFEDVMRLLRRCKVWLEGALSASGHRLLAFRAGGWCIQPSQAVVRALLEFGFRVDSTVAPGFRNRAPGEWSDFRGVPTKPYWRTDGDVCAESTGGLWEVPIATGKINRWRHYQAVKGGRAAGDGGMAPGCRGSYQGPDGGIAAFRGKLGKVGRLGRVMLDFSTMPAAVLIEVSRQWQERFAGTSGPVPLVAIAHTKNFTEASERHLADYLAWAQDQGFEFSTYGKWLEAIRA